MTSIDTYQTVGILRKKDRDAPPPLKDGRKGVPQGAFVLAKATDGPAVAVESIGHLLRYLRFLFGRPEENQKEETS